jgi:hypothetical protein
MPAQTTRTAKMKTMKISLASLAMGFLLAGAGCGKNEAVKDMEALADRVCACKDVACASEEMKKATELMTKHKDTRGTESDMKAITAAGQRMTECMQKIGK